MLWDQAGGWSAEQASKICSTEYNQTDGDDEGHWGYIPCQPLAIGTSVTVRAVAVDALGGIGVAQETVIVTDGYPGTSPDLIVCGDNR